MVQRKESFTRLSSNYLFATIAQKKKEFLEKHPDAQLVDLGIGDTTQPIPPVITDAMAKAANNLATAEGYHGYGVGLGDPDLRQAVATTYYHDIVDSEEITISDGAKCDLGRLQVLFGKDVSIAVQDPAYPVYVDGSLVEGVKNVTYLPCTPDNQFFPDLNLAKGCDLIYFCSPNNPTGAVATKEQLIDLVAFAEANQAIIIFDAAYSPYISDPNLPKSIYEVPGARQVAIEVNSFSKMAGFTGVRLGWTVVPKELSYSDGTLVAPDWKRLINTIFNAASNIVQPGGTAAMSIDGQAAIHHLIDKYKENARALKSALETKQGWTVYSGQHAPYLWVKVEGKTSWETFQHLLEEAQIICTPGVGFGPSGEGFVRFSALGTPESIQEATLRFAEIR